MTKDMTKGSPIKLILLFCIPLLFGNLFQQLYNMVDTIVVGKYIGVEALAAVGATGALQFLFIGFVTGLCLGFSIPIAQDFGAKNISSMKKSFTSSIYLSVFFSILMTILTLTITKPLLVLLNTPENIIEQSYDYIFIIFAGISSIVLYNLLSSVLRALGDSKSPLIFLIIASIINIILDILFVNQFNAGVKGVAYATVISQTVSGLLCLIYIKTKFSILHLTKEDWTLDIKSLLRSIKYGVPMGGQFAITAIGAIILQVAINKLGSDVVASVTAMQKIQMLVFMPMETLGVTLATYCGQNLGAQKIDRIKKGMKQSTILILSYSIFAFIFMALFGKVISLLFINSSDVQIIDMVYKCILINASFYPFLAIIFLYRNSIQGLGYSTIAMMAGLFELISRSIVALFILSGNYGFDLICFANPIAWVSANFILVPVYIFAIKKLNKKYNSPLKFV